MAGRHVMAAIELHRLAPISFSDAMIVHAARAANVAVLYSEDLGNESVLAACRRGIFFEVRGGFLTL